MTGACFHCVVKTELKLKYLLFLVTILAVEPMFRNLTDAQFREEANTAQQKLK